MDNRGKRQASSIFGGMGFYIALLVCVLAAGVVGYFALLGNEPELEDPIYQPVDQMDPGDTVQVAEPREEPAKPVVKEQPVVVKERPVIAPDPIQEAEAVSAPDPEPEVTPVVVKKEAPLITAPLAGETLAVFSVDALTYDPTLGDWRTHDGVDIQASAGTKVVATSAGTVRSVGQDDALGTMVVIDHPDGTVTTYASLEAEPAVGPGDEVSAGTAIGTVGNTSLSEAALGAHLHFAVAKDGKSVDPAEYLA